MMKLKKNQERKKKLESTNITRNLGHKTTIIAYKVNKINKLEAQPNSVLKD